MEGGFIALDTALTDELEAEGTARDAIRAIQGVRKQLALHVSDRIRVTLYAPEAVATALTAHRDLVAGEVLAEALDVAGSDAAAADATTVRELGEGVSVRGGAGMTGHDDELAPILPEDDDAEAATGSAFWADTEDDLADGSRDDLAGASDEEEEEALDAPVEHGGGHRERSPACTQHCWHGRGRPRSNSASTPPDGRAGSAR